MGLLKKRGHVFIKEYDKYYIYQTYRIYKIFHINHVLTNFLKLSSNLFFYWS